ncbi:cell division protein FtsQ/DivIB [Acetobacterium tundrae]|uniref:FtsQ-type POTRA domain-containing protein n=1 Tax=Acetobacterium tundrae TaxID=132932 RepID=A0ABR6WHA4_9FIRM|nr:FtsQ-type POTRA domain-containing protein [Acetobacterium tundrae]MBC3795839.1 FtsQ-type POTRA domain-containing protein [Acetobacterium tundrae]
MKRSKKEKVKEKPQLYELSKEELREQRRQQRKIKKRKRIIKSLIVILVILGIIGGLSFASYEAVKQGFFNVSEIEVVGNEIVDDQTVIDASGIQIGESIFLVDINKANYSISSLLNLDDLVISKVMPNKILISLKESTPICAVNDGNNVFYLTRDKKLIENSGYLRKTDIPLVFGCESVNAPGIGQEVVIEPYWRFDTVMNVLIDLKDSGYLEKISEVRMTDNNTYEIVTKNGTIFSFWDYNNYSENENYILNNLAENTSNMLINLTVGTKPVIKAR